MNKEFFDDNFEKSATLIVPATYPAGHSLEQLEDMHTRNFSDIWRLYKGDMGNEENYRNNVINTKEGTASVYLSHLQKGETLRKLFLKEIVEKVGDSFFPSIYPVLALFRENENFILDNTCTFNNPKIFTFFKNYNNELARASVSKWYGKPCFDTFLCKDLENITLQDLNNWDWFNQRLMLILPDASLNFNS